MRPLKITILFLPIFFIVFVRAESKFSDPKIGNKGVVVESVSVKESNGLEWALTNPMGEFITTKAYEETTLHPSQENNYIPRRSNKIPVNKKISKKINNMIEDDPNYVKGNFGGYYFVGSGKTQYYFFHGKYQKPSLNYYGNYNHVLKDNSTLGYYLGFSISKMDHNEYFRNHNYKSFKVHHYFYKNRTMLPEQYVSSDHLLHCAQNTSIFCPENTEAICLQNTTVWCATRISFAKRCEEEGMGECVVSTRLPCIRSDSPGCEDLVEKIDMPCIAKIKISDPMEDKNGNTLVSVAGTFVLSTVSPIKDRTYCVTIVAEPSKD